MLLQCSQQAVELIDGPVLRLRLKIACAWCITSLRERGLSCLPVHLRPIQNLSTSVLCLHSLPFLLYIFVPASLLHPPSPLPSSPSSFSSPPPSLEQLPVWSSWLQHQPAPWLFSLCCDIRGESKEDKYEVIVSHAPFLQTLVVTVLVHCEAKRRTAEKV